MPKHDACHDIVADALRREGWQVDNDLRRQRDERLIYIDLRASKDDRTAFIEVKCFPNLAEPDEQYSAVGQYLIYQTFLCLENINNPLYLAVSVTIYEDEFDEIMLQTLRANHINVLIFDETGERSRQWITW